MHGEETGEANMAEQLPAGWYSTGAGVRRYWTGSEWVTPEASTTPPLPPRPLPVAIGAPPPAMAPRARRGRKSVLTAASVVVAILGVLAAGTWLLSRKPPGEAQFVAQCEDALVSQLSVSSRAAITDVRLLTVENGETEYTLGLNQQLLDAGAYTATDDVEQSVEETLAAYELGGTTVLWATGEADGREWMCRARLEGGTYSGLRIVGFDGDFVPNAYEDSFPATLRDRD